MRYLGLVILIYALTLLTKLAFVSAFLGACFIKKKVHKMNGETWDLYFKSMDTSAYLIRFWLLYVISIALVSIVGYFSFNVFGFSYPILLTIITALFGIIKTAYKFKKNKHTLIEKISSIRTL